MIHYRKHLDLEALNDPVQMAAFDEQVAAFEKMYDDLLELARTEYEYEPPTRYYKDGYNLYKRMKEYKENHLLFLHNLLVPTDNNLSERLLRVLKRKFRQVISFRSFQSLEYLCNCMGILASMETHSQNTYLDVATIFDPCLANSSYLPVDQSLVGDVLSSD